MHKMGMYCKQTTFLRRETRWAVCQRDKVILFSPEIIFGCKVLEAQSKEACHRHGGLLHSLSSSGQFDKTGNINKQQPWGKEEITIIDKECDFSSCCDSHPCVAPAHCVPGASGALPHPTPQHTAGTPSLRATDEDAK